LIGDVAKLSRYVWFTSIRHLLKSGRRRLADNLDQIPPPNGYFATRASVHL
jgi:hypothetical protein